MNEEANDFLTDEIIINSGYWDILIFDTYINDEKLEKELWRANNWTYKRNSKWSAEYSLIITNQTINNE
jgi:hypothetical protein